MPENNADTRSPQSAVSRRSILTGTLAGLMAPTAALALGADTAAAAGPGIIRPLGTTRHITVYAEPLPGGLYGYGLAPGQGRPSPGPLLEMYEGDTLEIELVNNTDQRLSIHPHGVDYNTASDGSPLQRLVQRARRDPHVHLGQPRASTQRTTATGMPGSAGYWHYHDHAHGRRARHRRPARRASTAG